MTSTILAPSISLGGRKIRTIFKASVATLCLCVFAPAVSALDKPLRQCADPENLPFSSDRSDNPGIYREIAKAIAQDLNRPLTEVWYRTYFGKRATRVTLLAKQCDFSVGLPSDSDFMGPALIFSRPFMKAGYALVLKKPLTVSSWGELKGKTIAVQHNSTPQNFLADKPDIVMLTELSPEDVVKAVATGAADAAFVWAPTAGYLNKTVYSGGFTIIPIDGPGMQWPIAVAFGKRDGALRDAVNGALDKMGDKIAELKEKYGFPAAEPVTLADTAPQRPAEQTAAEPSPAATQPAQSTSLEASPAPAPASEGGSAAMESASLTPPPAAGEGSGEDRIREGKEVFNGTCAHCHGPDAIQAERKINLRLLRHRYGVGMEDMFFKTVNNGRPSKGMPSWKDVFTQDQFVSIFAFLKTVQED